MKNSIKKFLRNDIDLLEEYKVFDSSGLIKLDAMENPFDFNVSCEFKNKSLSVNLNRYPDANCENLKKLLKSKNHLDDNFDVIIGNGSDELIQLICFAFLKPSNIVLCPHPSFSMYKKIAQVVGLKFKEVALKKDFSLDIELMLDTIKKIDPAVIFLAYPNNPTGNLWSKNDIDLIIKNTNGVVIIDEAYGDFSKQSYISEMRKYENLLIMKTFSKIGFAGLRVGYLFGKKEIIKELNKLRLPFNINSFSQKISEFHIIENDISKQTNEIIKNKELLIKELLKIDNITVFQSATNFVLFRLENQSADNVFEKLINQKILVKNMSNTPSLNNCLRVTVGTKNENELFIQSLKNSII